jgi:hypothetical protein
VKPPIAHRREEEVAPDFSVDPGDRPAYDSALRSFGREDQPDPGFWIMVKWREFMVLVHDSNPASTALLPG